MVRQAFIRNLAFSAIVAGAMLGWSAHPATAQPEGQIGEKGQPLQTQDISLDQSHAILAAAVAKAEEIETKMDIAIVDAGGNLK